MVRLALAAVDDVRRRVQHAQTGHRGRTGDPLDGIRRVLRRRADPPAVKARARLEAGLIAGDPNGETTIAWTVAQQVWTSTSRTTPTRPAPQPPSCLAPTADRQSR